MADDRCGEPQLREALGLFYAGALPDDEMSTVAGHLATCAGCLAESDELGEAAMMLALLSSADRDDLVAEFGLPDAGTSAPVGLPDAGTSRVGGTDIAGTRPRPHGPVRPRRVRRRPRRLALAGAGLAVVLFMLAAVTVGQPMLARLIGADPPTTLVADAANESTGATLSVTVTASGADVELYATVTGLTAGEPYRFYVTDIGGRSWELVTFTGVGRLQQVDTACPVPIDGIARFSITARDGSLVVAASTRPDPTSTPPG
ncbi:hypothetical protein EDC02_5230 [Micromonospora sp. Llam0]|uniref:zf-HC2 domain-containing protein n=1 Tax=Micromonospora sp. Llam0 TaxID=2485143 RepID=UPI000F4617A1|nr:zf-HC2 domain-containing protein [Micromonospora sp. Llam0]ROO63210.1 hypothetical protein EDC02_5230 [Micromonospora sp. Llam0]